MSDAFTMTIGGRTVTITSVPAEPIEIQQQTTPPRPADDSPYLQLWLDKKLPASVVTIRNHLAATYGAVCRLCLQAVDMSLPGTDLDGPQVDHITAKGRGGAHTWGNVQLVHGACNNLKNEAATDREPEQYAANLDEALLFRRSVALAVADALVSEDETTTFGERLARVTSGDSEDPADREIDGARLSERQFAMFAPIHLEHLATLAVKAWETAERRAADAGYADAPSAITAEMLGELPELEVADWSFGERIVPDSNDEHFADWRRTRLTRALADLHALAGR